MIARPFHRSIWPIQAGGTRNSVRPGAFLPQNQDKEIWEFRSKKIFTFLTSPTPRHNNRPKRGFPGRNMIARPFNTSIRPIQAGGTRISVRPGAFPPQNQDKEFWDFRLKNVYILNLADSNVQQQIQTTLPRKEHDCNAFPYIHLTDSSRWDKDFGPSRSFSPTK